MAVRTRDWLKFGALVALAFVFGLAFASTLDLPRKGGATPLIPEAQAAGGTAVQIPPAKPPADIGNAFVAGADHVTPAAGVITPRKGPTAGRQRPPARVGELLPPKPRRPQGEP